MVTKPKAKKQVHLIGLTADEWNLIADAAAVGATREYYVGAQLRKLRRLLRHIST